MGKLVAYSGFSASNYLEQPYNADLDFGTGDFCVMGWLETSSSVSGALFDSRDASGDYGIFILTTSGGDIQFSEKDTTTNTTISSASVNSGSWRHFCCVRSSSGTLKEIYIDGSLDVSEVVTARDVSSVDLDPSYVGIAFSQVAPATGSLALLRIGATAPSAEQIRRIYEDEKLLFQENADATLYGTSDAVTALAHDPVTDLLHAGTSDGRSVFQGLRRVENTTDAVGTAISAVDGFVADE